MKLYIHTAYKYIKGYKSRSFSICMSMILSIALIVGMASLFKSAKQADADRMIYEDGRNHVTYKEVSKKQCDMLSKGKDNYIVGFKQYHGWVDDDRLTLARADANYIKLRNSKIIKGRMPNKEGEIVLEPWVIDNLQLKGEIGEQITFDSTNEITNEKKREKYSLVGIIQDRKIEKSRGYMEGTLSMEGVRTGVFDAFVCFNKKTEVKAAIRKLQKACNIKSDNVNLNSLLVEALERCNASDFDLMVVFAIAVFVGIVIYGIFKISTLQRTSEYGTLKALGANPLQIFMFIWSELFLLFLISIPFGTLLGFWGAKLFGPFAGQLYTEGSVRISRILLSKEALLLSVAFLLIIIFLISILLCIRIRKISAISAITNQMNRKEIKKVVKARVLTGLLTLTQIIAIRNIGRNKKAFFSTVLTIALGGIIFIVSNFSAGLMKADSGQNSFYRWKPDIEITSGLEESKIAITDKEIAKIRNIAGVQNIDCIQEKNGGVIIPEDKMKSTEYRDWVNEVCKAINGLIVKIKNKKDYLAKGHIFGYNEKLLTGLEEYLIDGKIDIDRMNREDVVLYHIPLDWNGQKIFDFKVGDKIKVKYIKDTKVTLDTMKMKDNLDYIEKEYTIGGIVSESTISYDYYTIYDAEIILSNKKFEEAMGYDNYGLVNVKLDKNVNSKMIKNRIMKIVKDIPGCIVIDMGDFKAELKAFNNQKIGYVYAITLILFMISLFNIINNITYSLISRIGEFSVIRAIGLDNKGFKEMILFEGMIYGVVSGVLTAIGSIAGQIVWIKIMGYKYSQLSINYKLYILMIVLNLFICMAATYIPSRKIKKMSIVKSINNME